MARTLKSLSRDEWTQLSLLAVEISKILAKAERLREESEDFKLMIVDQFGLDRRTVNKLVKIVKQPELVLEDAELKDLAEKYLV